MIEKRFFDRHPCGIPVYAYTIRSEMLEVTVLNYGGIINSLKVKDKQGNFRDVVGGFDKIVDYIDSGEYQGAIIGRVCNRIKNARYTIDGIDYSTYANEGKNVCHAGRYGFNAKIWDIDIVSIPEKKREFMILKYESPDGEEGFPGKLTTSVSYEIVNENRLVIDYMAWTDKPTIVNFTNHSYFNMNGYDSGSTEDQYIMVNADRITETDSELIPTGNNISVDGTGFDLRRLTKLGDVYASDTPKILELGGLDTNFVLNDYDKKLKKQAEMYSNESAIKMNVYTDQSSILVYSSNKIKETEPNMKNDIKQVPHFGVCFEAAAMPDAINHDNFDNIILRPEDRPYTAKTAFEFNIELD